jgi:YD repeat-containing protein
MYPLQIAVEAAVRALVEQTGPMDAEQVHAALWPAVREAAAPYAPRSALPAASTRDRRAKHWQYTVKFWDAAGELIGETDPARMEGTGGVPEILAGLAEQLHGFVPAEMHPEATRARLPQLRNNLGRQPRAVMRIGYADGQGQPHVCQVDIHRLEG